MRRALTLLNEAGDVTIVWDEADDEKMIAIIEKKLAEGVVFFLIEPRLGGLMPPKKTALRQADDALRQRAVSIHDEDVARFLETSATAETMKSPEKPVRARKRSTDPKEIAASESVGVRQLRGG